MVRASEVISRSLTGMSRASDLIFQKSSKIIYHHHPSSIIKISIFFKIAQITFIISENQEGMARTHLGTILNGSRMIHERQLHFSKNRQKMIIFWERSQKSQVFWSIFVHSELTEFFSYLALPGSGSFFSKFDQK